MTIGRTGRGLSDAELTSAVGGLQLRDARESTNVEDRRNEPQWTPTEDGRIVGPHGEWDWDPSINENQPPEIDHSQPGNVNAEGVDLDSLHRAEEADANLRASPEYQELANYSHDALNGNLTPTEDGHMVGSNGHVYDDPTINQNQYQEHTPEPGEYVGQGDPYEGEQNGGEAPYDDGQPGGGYEEGGGGGGGGEGSEE